MLNPPAKTTIFKLLPAFLSSGFHTYPILTYGTLPQPPEKNKTARRFLFRI